VRTTNIGGKEIQLRANPLALLYYKQEFDRDLIADFIELKDLEAIQHGDFSKFDMLAIFRFAYAMNRAATPKDAGPNFEQWLSELDSVGLDDPDWLLAVFDEAVEGFFRSGQSAPPKNQKSK